MIHVHASQKEGLLSLSSPSPLSLSLSVLSHFFFAKTFSMSALYVPT
jgi:hypothetical protein